LWSGSASSPRFLLLRNARHGTWSFAKGHLEPGEDLFAGALREVKEETGVVLEPSDLDLTFSDTSIYRPGGGDWKRVVYFLAIPPIAEDGLQVSSEHQDFAWLSEEDALARLQFSDLRRTLIRAVTRLADRPAESADG
jgi:8-oxo-dGTP diphosphatase